jgi:uncharacterized protein
MSTTTLHLIHARSFVQRLGGLLIRPRLAPGQALVLAPCSSVHTLFMRYAIDVVFVNRAGLVLKVVHQLGPWRAAWCWGACAAIELAAGQAQARGITAGGRISWRDTA